MVAVEVGGGLKVPPRWRTACGERLALVCAAVGVLVGAWTHTFYHTVSRSTAVVIVAMMLRWYYHYYYYYYYYYDY